MTEQQLDGVSTADQACRSIADRFFRDAADRLAAGGVQIHLIRSQMFSTVPRNLSSFAQDSTLDIIDDI